MLRGVFDFFTRCLRPANTRPRKKENKARGYEAEARGISLVMSFLFTFQLRNGTVPGHSDPALLKLQMAGLLWLPVE